jgi:hypothetical protein
MIATVYGICPICGAPVTDRTRGGRGDGTDTCSDGHRYLSHFTHPTMMQYRYVLRLREALNIVAMRLEKICCGDIISVGEASTLANRIRGSLAQIQLFPVTKGVG